MKHLLKWTALLLIAPVILISCDEESENEAPTLTLTSPSNDATVNGTLIVSGVASDDNAVNTLTLSLLSGTTVVWTTSENPAEGESDKTSVTFQYSYDLEANQVVDGNYTLEVSLSDEDGKSTTLTRAVVVTGADPGVKETADVSLGAQGNTTLGSYLDVDNMTVYSSSQVATNNGVIDVVLGVVGAKTSLMSQAYAKTAEFNANLSSTDEALIANTTLTETQFNDVTTYSTITSTYTAAADSAAQIKSVKAGVVYAIKTDNSATPTYALLYVESVVTGTNGSITVNGKAKKPAPLILANRKP